MRRHNSPFFATGPAGGGRTSRGLRLLLGNLAVLAVFVALLELAFGAWVFHDPVRILNIPRNVHLEHTIDSSYFPDGPSVYRRDRWGLRGAYGSPAAIDILTIGGSTTEQRYIDEGRTWQDVLQENFATDGVPLTVASAGVSGQSTFGHIRNFDLWFPHVPGLRPRYILAYVGNNDMFLESPNDHWDEVAETTESLRERIRDRSALLYLRRTVRGMRAAQRHGLSDRLVDFENGTWVAEPARNDHERVLERRIDAYGRRLSLLIDRIEAFGATPIIVTQARGDYRIEDGRVVGLADAQGRSLRGFVDDVLGDLDTSGLNGVDHYRILSLFNERTMRVCRERGAICIDLGSELNFRIGDFYDYTHNTPRGVRKIGDYLHSRLREEPRFRPMEHSRTASRQGAGPPPDRPPSASAALKPESSAMPRAGEQDQ